MTVNKDGTITISKEEFIASVGLVLRAGGIDDNDDELLTMFAEFAYHMGVFLFDCGNEVKETVEANAEAYLETYAEAMKSVAS